MMKITEQELNHLLAEKVSMKGLAWCCPNQCSRVVKDTSGNWVDWNPTSDERHAIQVLAEWCRREDLECTISIQIDRHEIVYVVTIDAIPLLQVRGEDLCHAICLAVAEAEKGIKYELVKE